MLTCRSAAKVNLTLDVLARRQDGYHELQSVVHTIGLWDTLTFEFGAGGIMVACDDPQLAGDNNLCAKAARAWLKAALAVRQMRFSGVKITLAKNIPAGAGLGGGSGNAAATLLALNHSFSNLLDNETLQRVAITLGADVPLFLRGGCALMEGIGDRLTPLPPLDGWLVIIQPPVGFSTPEVYRKWDELGQASAASTPAMCAAIEKRDLQQVANTLQNDLTTAAQLTAPPGLDIAAICANLRRHGALGAAMSGSGSAVFGLFGTEAAAQQAARELAGAAPANGQMNRVLVAPFTGSGVEFLSCDSNT